APLYAKFGLRNAQAVYPSGHHLEAVACANAIEKVHRAAVALDGSSTSLCDLCVLCGKKEA
ncbi:MAG: hypothetical protein ACLQNE_32340, partial [Thermoguttaceae bacterium]